MQEFKAVQSTRQEVYRAFRQARGVRLKERYYCILLAYDGLSLGQMAAILGREHTTLRDWIALFNEGGLERLRKPITPSAAKPTDNPIPYPAARVNEEENA